MVGFKWRTVVGFTPRTTVVELQGRTTVVGGGTSGSRLKQKWWASNRER